MFNKLKSSTSRLAADQDNIGFGVTELKYTLREGEGVCGWQRKLYVTVLIVKAVLTHYILLE